jgi:hypothetical protein
MASIPFNQDLDPDKSSILTRINHDFKPIQLWLQSFSIKTSDPDQSGLQTDSIMASIPLNQDFRPGSIKTFDPDQ